MFDRSGNVWILGESYGIVLQETFYKIDSLLKYLLLNLFNKVFTLVNLCLVQKVILGLFD